MFRKKGISYISIMPRFTEEEGYCNSYFSILSGRKSNAKKTIRGYVAEYGNKTYGQNGRIKPSVSRGDLTGGGGAEGNVLQIPNMLNPEIRNAVYGKDSDIVIRGEILLRELVEKGYRVELKTSESDPAPLVLGSDNTKRLELTVKELYRKYEIRNKMQVLEEKIRRLPADTDIYGMVKFLNDIFFDFYLPLDEEDLEYISSRLGASKKSVETVYSDASRIARFAEGFTDNSPDDGKYNIFLMRDAYYLYISDLSRGREAVPFYFSKALYQIFSEVRKKDMQSTVYMIINEAKGRMGILPGNEIPEGNLAEFKDVFKKTISEIYEKDPDKMLPEEKFASLDADAIRGVQNAGRNLYRNIAGLRLKDIKEKGVRFIDTSETGTLVLFAEAIMALAFEEWTGSKEAAADKTDSRMFYSKLSTELGFTREKAADEGHAAESLSMPVEFERRASRQAGVQLFSVDKGKALGNYLFELICFSTCLNEKRSSSGLSGDIIDTPGEKNLSSEDAGGKNYINKKASYIKKAMEKLVFTCGVLLIFGAVFAGTLFKVYEVRADVLERPVQQEKIMAPDGEGKYYFNVPQVSRGYADNSHTALLPDNIDLNINADTARKLRRALPGISFIPESVTPQKVEESIQLSNSDEYQDLVKKTYAELLRSGLWGRADGFYPVLFLKGLDRRGFAMALQAERTIVVGLGEFDMFREKGMDLIEELGSKIVHEGTHLYNDQRYRGDLPLLSDEALAFEKTARHTEIYSDSNAQISAQRAVADAFWTLLKIQKRLPAMIGAPTFRDIYYNNIELVSDGSVNITLYDMSDPYPEDVKVNVSGDKVRVLIQRPADIPEGYKYLPPDKGPEQEEDIHGAFPRPSSDIRMAGKERYAPVRNFFLSGRTVLISALAGIFSFSGKKAAASTGGLDTVVNGAVGLITSETDILVPLFLTLTFSSAVVYFLSLLSNDRKINGWIDRFLSILYRTGTGASSYHQLRSMLKDLPGSPYHLPDNDHIFRRTGSSIPSGIVAEDSFYYLQYENNGDISRGYTESEKQEWLEKGGQVLPHELDLDIADIIYKNAELILDREEELGNMIRLSLLAKGVPYALVGKYLESVKEILQDPLAHFRFMRTDVLDRDKYFLGDFSTLAVDVIDHLNGLETGSLLTSDLLRNRDLVAEYILHEVLENTPLDHYEIIQMTTDFFERDRESPGIISGEIGPGKTSQTPLGKALADFLLARELMNNSSEPLSETDIERYEKNRIRVLSDSIIKDYSDRVSENTLEIFSIMIEGILDSRMGLKGVEGEYYHWNRPRMEKLILFSSLLSSVAANIPVEIKGREGAVLFKAICDRISGYRLRDETVSIEVEAEGRSVFTPGSISSEEISGLRELASETLVNSAVDSLTEKIARGKAPSSVDLLKQLSEAIYGRDAASLFTDSYIIRNAASEYRKGVYSFPFEKLIAMIREYALEQPSEDDVYSASRARWVKSLISGLLFGTPLNEAYIYNGEGDFLWKSSPSAAYRRKYESLSRKGAGRTGAVARRALAEGDALSFLIEYLNLPAYGIDIPPVTSLLVSDREHLLNFSLPGAIKIVRDVFRLEEEPGGRFIRDLSEVIDKCLEQAGIKRFDAGELLAANDTVQAVYRINLLDRLERMRGDIMKRKNMVDIRGGRTEKERLQGLTRWNNLLKGKGSGRTAIIPDIHGYVDGLRSLLEHIREKQIRNLVFLGDYFDRGKQNIDVFKELKDIKKKMNTVFLAGNHDIMFLSAMQGNLNDYFLWLQNGGTSFMNELGIDPLEQKADERLRRHPLAQEIRDWMLSELKLYHIDNFGVLYVHAGIQLDNSGNVIFSYTDPSGSSHRGLGALDALVADLRDNESRQEALAALMRKGSPVWIRAEGWEDIFADREMTDRVLDALAVNAIVFGHTPRSVASNMWDRIFAIDMALTDAYSFGEGGDLILDKNGITPVMMTGGKPTEWKELGVTSERLLEYINSAIDRLRKGGHSKGASLIGKLTDAEGRVIENDMIASRSMTDKGPVLHIKHEGELLRELPIRTRNGEIRTLGIERFLSKIETYRGIKTVPKHFSKKFGDLISSLKKGAVEKVILLERSEDGRDIKGVFSGGRLYLDEDLAEDVLAFIHELGEGYVSLPEGEEYAALSRHTFMRGAGKDVRRALLAAAKRGVDPATLSLNDMLNTLDKELEAMKDAGYISPEREKIWQNSSEGSFLTRSEQSLIAYNFDNSEESPGHKALYGMQDYLDPSGNLEFSVRIAALKNELLRDTLNIYIIPLGNAESRQVQQELAQKTSRRYRDKGLNSLVLHYGKEAPLSKQLEKALSVTMKQRNKEKIPKIFVNIMSAETKNEVEDFIEKAGSDRNETERIRSMVVMGRDSLPEGAQSPEDLMIDDVRVMMVGSAVMNDNRLRVDIGMSPEKLFEKRVNMLSGFAAAGVIDPSLLRNLNAGALEDIMQKIYRGDDDIIMRITPIRWEEVREYHDSMQTVLQSL
jgi:hypothetical protein